MHLEGGAGPPLAPTVPAERTAVADPQSSSRRWPFQHATQRPHILLENSADMVPLGESVSLPRSVRKPPSVTQAPVVIVPTVIPKETMRDTIAAVA